MKNEKDEFVFWKFLKPNKTTEASVEFIVLLVLVGKEKNFLNYGEKWRNGEILAKWRNSGEMAKFWRNGENGEMAKNGEKRLKR